MNLLYQPKLLLPYEKAKKTYSKFHARNHLYINKEATIEHIVPQKILKLQPNIMNEARCDMHNFLLFGGELNSAKGCYRYANSSIEAQKGKLNVHNYDPLVFNELGNIQKMCIQLDDKHHVVDRKNKLYIPPIHQRGIIARSIMYMVIMYSEYMTPIFSDIIDTGILLNWHQNCGVCKFEYDRNFFVSLIQGNSNPFVLYPDLVHRIIANNFKMNVDVDADADADAYIDARV